MQLGQLDLKSTLAQRMSVGEIRNLVFRVVVDGGDAGIGDVYSCACDSDDRVAYNALWVMTRFSDLELERIPAIRDELIDRLLVCGHAGKRRLILTLLDRLEAEPDSLRTDYLDYCLGNIISDEPYAVRALCMKQAYAQCRKFPDLMREFLSILELMEQGELSPGLRTAKRNILKEIDRSNSRSSGRKKVLIERF